VFVAIATAVESASASESEEEEWDADGVRMGASPSKSSSDAINASENGKSQFGVLQAQKLHGGKSFLIALGRFFYHFFGMSNDCFSKIYLCWSSEEYKSLYV